MRVVYEKLKQEEVYRNDYLDFQEAYSSIGEFLERVYNQKRLHSLSDTCRQSSSKTKPHYEMEELSLAEQRGLCPCDPGI